MQVGPSVLGLLMAAALTGCGGGRDAQVVTGTAPPRTVAARTQSAPAVFAERCRRAARDVTVEVLCPDLLPRGGFEAPRGYGYPPCSYLVNLEPRGAETRPGSVFHLLVGGTCRQWDLVTTGDRWPRQTRFALGLDLRLVGRTSLRPGGPPQQKRVRLRVIGRERVGSAPGLVLQNPPYPTGGIHGGHVTVVWNAGRAGYAVTGHTVGADKSLTPAARQGLRSRATATLLAVARSMRPADR